MPKTPRKVTTPEALPAMTPKPLLSAEDVCRVLGVTDRTLERMLSAGEIPQPVKVRSLNRWRWKDLMAWIDADCKPIGV